MGFETFRYLYTPEYTVDSGEVLECSYTAEMLRHKFTAMEQTGTGMLYYVFGNARECFEHMDAETARNKSVPCFHEVIFGHMPQRIKFDIDADMAAAARIPGAGTARDRVRIAINMLIDSIITAFYTTWMCDLDPGEIVYCRSTADAATDADEKMSYHIVIARAVPDSATAAEFTRRVMSILPTPYHHIVDTGVNKRVQCFRMTGSSKCGRIKHVLSAHTRMDTVITNIDNIPMMPALAVEDTRVQTDAHSEDVARALEIAAPSTIGHKYRKCVDGMLIFDRLHPTYCECCSRTHDSDNTLIVFLNVAHGIATVTLGCRRISTVRITLGSFTSAIGDESGSGAGGSGDGGSGDGGSGDGGSGDGVRMTHLDYVLANKSLPAQSLWQTLPNRTVYCEQTLRPFDLAGSHTLAIHAAMKMGKTKALAAFLRKFDSALRPPTVRILSFRQTFSHNLRKAFPDYAVYSDTRGDLTAQKLIVQVESLHRVSTREPVDVVVLDECESIFEQFDSGLLRDFSGAFAVFQWLLRYARVVIVLDAALGDRSFRVLARMRPGFTTGAMYVRNEWQPARDDAYEFTTRADTWLARVYAAVAAGTRVAVPISSLEDARALAGDIARRFPARNVKLYSSETGMAERREHFADVDEYWSRYDVLVYTPTISAGVSFERKHFDMVAGYFTDMSCPVETCVQMIGRIRDVASRRYLIYLQARGASLPTTADEIARAVWRSRASLFSPSVQLLAPSTPAFEYGPNGELRYADTDYFTVWSENVRVRNVSRNNFVRVFVESVRATGAAVSAMEMPRIPTTDASADVVGASAGADVDSAGAIVVYNMPAPGEISAGLVTASREHRTRCSDTVAGARELTDAEYGDLRRAIAGGEDVGDGMVRAMQLHRLRRCYRYDGIIDTRFVAVYSRAKLMRAFRNLTRLYALGDVDAGLESIRTAELENYVRCTEDACESALAIDINRRYVYDQHRLAIGMLRAAGWRDMYDRTYLPLTTLATNLRARHRDIVREYDQIYAHFGRGRKRPLPLSGDDSEYVAAALQVVNRAVDAMYAARVRTVGRSGVMYCVEPCGHFALEPDATARPYIKHI